MMASATSFPASFPSRSAARARPSTGVTSSISSTPSTRIQSTFAAWDHPLTLAFQQGPEMLLELTEIRFRRLVAGGFRLDPGAP